MEIHNHVPGQQRPFFTTGHWLGVALRLVPGLALAVRSLRLVSALVALTGCDRKV